MTDLPSSPQSRLGPDAGFSGPLSPLASSKGGSSIAESQGPGAVIGISMRSLSSRKLESEGFPAVEGALAAMAPTQEGSTVHVLKETRQGRRIEDGIPFYDEDGTRIISPEELTALLSRLNTPCPLSANGCRPKTEIETLNKLKRVRSRTRSMLSLLSTAPVAPLETWSEVSRISRGRGAKPPRWMYARSLGTQSLLPSDCRPSTLFI
jgi:hypothetical protein